MRGELRKRNDRYFLVLKDGILYNGDLSLKNCQAIERGYDLDELCENYATNPMSNFAKYGDEYVAKNSFGRGFQKALEILGDKRFTEEDFKLFARKYYREVRNNVSNLLYDQLADKCLKEHIQSLQQNEWEVEIIMECTQCQSYGYVSECRDNCNKKFLQPKLDAEGCIILKRVV